MFLLSLNLTEVMAIEAMEATAEGMEVIEEGTEEDTMAKDLLNLKL